ncbi:MAG: hypothetical protein AB8G99_15570 [Planctomycetaceae bacterium]
MLINRIVYGSWVVILLCAVGVAAFNLKSRPASPPKTSITPQVSAASARAHSVQPVGFQDDSPGRLPIVSDKDPLAETKLKELRRIVSEEMPGASDDKIQIWAEEFKDVPEQMVRFMLRQKRANDDGSTGALMPVLTRPKLEEPPAAVHSADSLDAIKQARAAVIKNLLNVETVGHRSQIVEFAATPLGVQVAETRFLMTKGSVRHTDRPLDVMIEEGFFVVTADDRSYFTRAGRFMMNAERQLVLRVGQTEYTLAGLEPVPATASDIKVSSEGAITATTADGSAAIGQIKVARFLDSSRMASNGDCLFAETAQSGSAQFDFKPVISQGVLELSNGRTNSLQLELSRLNHWEALLEVGQQSLTKPE